MMHDVWQTAPQRRPRPARWTDPWEAVGLRAPKSTGIGGRTFLQGLSPHGRAMRQRGGEQAAAAADLQPPNQKSDSLLASLQIRAMPLGIAAACA